MKIILGIVLVLIGFAFILLNKRFAEWFYNKTQMPSYSLFTFFVVKVDQNKYKNFWIIADRCGSVLWGLVLIVAGLLNLLG